MKINLSDDRKACFLVGYLARRLVENDEKNNKYYKEKLLGIGGKINIDSFMRIYKWVVMNDWDDGEHEELLIKTSELLLLNDERIRSLNVGYYYTLGFTSKKIEIDGNDIVYK